MPTRQGNFLLLLSYQAKIFFDNVEFKCITKIIIKRRLSYKGYVLFQVQFLKTLKKHLKKGGYNYSNIVDNWTKIVSKKISDACYPITVKMGKNMKDGTLVLNVIHGKEMKVEYEKNEIIDKINSFFGYNCISKMTLKIVQNKIKKKTKFFPKIKNLKKLKIK